MSKDAGLGRNPEFPYLNIICCIVHVYNESALWRRRTGILFCRSGWLGSPMKERIAGSHLARGCHRCRESKM